MKVNQKILSIPPYVSTSWKNVISLHAEKRDDNSILIIGLVNGSTIEIPNLDKTTIESIFSAHEKYIEQDSTPSSKETPPSIFPSEIMEDSALLSLPLPLGLDANMGNMLQHNPDAASSPDLPKEVLEKIAAVSKVVGFETGENLPKPEPHCNCTHCQIMSVLQDEEELPAGSIEHEEEVSDEDLSFRNWEIAQSGDKLYIVTNPLNAKEQYNVYLGTPVGCTCGTPNCEHISSVLNS